MDSVTPGDPASRENNCGDQKIKNKISKRSVSDLKLYFSTKDSMIHDPAEAPPPVPKSLMHSKPSPAAKTRPRKINKPSKLPSKCNNQPSIINYLKNENFNTDLQMWPG